MAITHEWTGTVLTITSDSGTSSCDLKGEKGDDGPRGPQGAAGSCLADDTKMLGGKPASDYALKADTIPPIGIVLPFWNDTEPAAIWGGVWELLAEGLTLIQSGSTYPLGSTGGEANHTLTANEMPSHSGHLYNNSGIPYNIGNATGKLLDDNVLSDFGTIGRGWNITNGEAYPAGVDRGNSQPHNNMPPYLAVNLWKRTA